MSITDKDLWRQQAYVAGQWIAADNGETLSVVNPATGAHLGTVPKMGADETCRAIKAAHVAGTEWRARTGKERAAMLKAWYELMMRHQDDLAALMTAEQGKPLAESRGEIAYAASFIEWFAEEAKRVYGGHYPRPCARQAHRGADAADRCVRRHHALELSCGHDHRARRARRLLPAALWC